MKKMLKKIYMIDFNEPSVRRDHPIIVKHGGISCKSKIFFEIMEKKTCKITTGYLCLYEMKKLVYPTIKVLKRRD